MAEPSLPAIPDPALPELLAELARAPASALARFPALASATQFALVLAAPAERRLELLLVAPAPAELIQALPAPIIAQTVTAGEDDAEVLLQHASAAQIASAIDLDCRRRGRLLPGRFRRWIGLLVAASRSEATASLRAIDLDLLAAGLAPLVRMDPRAASYARHAEAFGGHAPILIDDFDCDDEEAWAFLRLLDAEAPERLAALGAALSARDDEEIANEDYAAYEERMASIGLRDWAQAAESVAEGIGRISRQRMAAEDGEDGEDAGGAGRMVSTAAAARFLADAMTALIAREDCDHACLDRLAAEIARSANDAIVAADAGADEAQARAARARVDAGIARALARLSGGDCARAAELLLRTPIPELLRVGSDGGASALRDASG